MTRNSVSWRLLLPEGSTCAPQSSTSARDRLRALSAVAAIRAQKPVQFRQRLPVDVALEFDHRIERNPEFVPAPGVEFRVSARAQPDVAVAPQEPQQVPDLLLPSIGATPVAPHPLF